jgi:hypothetical protein
MKMTKIKLLRVEFMPKALEPGILYVAEEYGAAAHLCACGCGAKIRTPLGDTEWQLQETSEGPSLRPSVGNWQQKCRSHYVIRNGRIRWEGAWTEEQVLAGRRAEQVRRATYYADRYARQGGWWNRFCGWLKRMFG